MKLFIGGLPFGMGPEDLRSLFAESGEVTDVHIPTDRDTGNPRGFAFVTMSSRGEGTAAIKKLDGYQIDGRTLRVNEAQPKPEGHGFGGGSNRPSGGRSSQGNRGGSRRY